MCLEQKDYPEELEDPSYNDSPEELDMLEAMMELNSSKTKLH